MNRFLLCGVGVMLFCVGCADVDQSTATEVFPGGKDAVAQTTSESARAKPVDASADASGASGLNISAAKIRMLIPGTDKTVGYFVFNNDTDERVELVAAASSQVRAIEFHETALHDGVSRMRRLQSVKIEPGEQAEFKPGGKHLMLFGVEKLQAPITIELQTRNGSTVTAEFQLFGLLEQP